VRITESAIETLAIKLFEKLGYAYIYSLSTASDRDNHLPKTISGRVRFYI
jgi:hypothetical protein